MCSDPKPMVMLLIHKKENLGSLETVLSLDETVEFDDEKILECCLKLLRQAGDLKGQFLFISTTAFCGNCYGLMGSRVVISVICDELFVKEGDEALSLLSQRILEAVQKAYNTPPVVVALGNLFSLLGNRGKNTLN